MDVDDDQWRPNVMRLMAELRPLRRLRLFTTNWTLYEALSIARRTDPRYAVVLNERAQVTSTVVRIDQELEREAVRRFFSWTDKKASVVDHANTVAAVQTRCEAILSFDRDFIPLAAAAGLRILR
jgi:predicted nucleic acid-binding protein